MNPKRDYAYKKKFLRYSASFFDAVGTIFRRSSSLPSEPPKKILVVRLDQLGDLLQTLPVFESLRESYPKAKIGFLTTTQGADIQGITNLADEVYIWDCAWFGNRKPTSSIWDVFRWIRRSNYDCALELRGDIRLIALIRLAGVPFVIGYGATGGGFLLDVEVPWSRKIHAVDRNLALVEALGGKVKNRIPVLAPCEKQAPAIPSKTSSNHRLIIHPDAGTSAKRWPVDHFIQTINFLLKSENVEIVLVGLNELLGADIEKKLRRPVTNLMGKTTFPELVNVFRGSTGLLSNDSGPAHLMAALGKPVWVVWSGTASAGEWAPRGPMVKLFTWDVSCAPCSLSECTVPGHPCLEKITPETVALEIERSL